ncbi:hypothetical protein NPIL_622931 [Nephila pilipes]|uniref:Uncharacterized protein n=1 Tax=Nephila pilipes TaxID=299642 RepID=A0A8X6MWU5_NEPPI|nr:hypothetical protein NPIL_622931 [Nephila pilipes]
MNQWGLGRNAFEFNSASLEEGQFTNANSVFSLSIICQPHRLLAQLIMTRHITHLNASGIIKETKSMQLLSPYRRINDYAHRFKLLIRTAHSTSSMFPVLFDGISGNVLHGQ